MSFDTYANIITGAGIVFILAFTAWTVVDDHQLRAACKSRNGYWFSTGSDHVCLRMEAVMEIP